MNTAEQQASYYARIVPILGEGLRAKRIAVCGVAAVAGVVERLAGCRALRWWIADDAPVTADHPLAWGSGAAVGAPANAALAACLRAHNGWETGWDFALRPALTVQTFAALAADLRADPPDLLLAGGDAATLALLGALARDLDVPALLVAYLGGDDPHAACLALLPGDGGQGRDWPDLLNAMRNAECGVRNAEYARQGWMEANGVGAMIARALLLHGTPAADSALDGLLWQERRTAVLLSTAAWPWAIWYVNLAATGTRPPVGGPEPPATLTNRQPPALPPHSALSTQHSALIVGCGSLGSLAARGLWAGGAARRLVLVDGETVDAANPVRQFFHTDQVGQAKVRALARNLAALRGTEGGWTEERTEGVWTLHGAGCEIVALPTQLADDRAGLAAFRRLLRATRPAVAVLATGSQVDYALARVLRGANIPHVVGRCYPRARYFEAIVVDGRRGPCFGCLRGHLYTGPAPRPTPEEALRYARAAAPGELQGEPATAVESGRAADVLVRLAGALARPRRARPAWLAALLAAGQTCLIGGNTAQPAAGPEGTPGWAYGIRLPGQVVAFGAGQVLGGGERQVCPDCGQALAVRYAV